MTPCFVFKLKMIFAPQANLPSCLNLNLPINHIFKSENSNVCNTRELKMDELCEYETNAFLFMLQNSFFLLGGGGWGLWWCLSYAQAPRLAGAHGAMMQSSQLSRLNSSDQPQTSKVKLQTWELKMSGMLWTFVNIKSMSSCLWCRNLRNLSSLSNHNIQCETSYVGKTWELKVAGTIWIL